MFVFFLSMAEQYVSQGNALSAVLFVCTSNSLLEVLLNMVSKPGHNKL